MIKYVETAIQSLLVLAGTPKKEMSQDEFEKAVIEIAVMLMVTQMGGTSVSVTMNEHTMKLVEKETTRIIEHFRDHPLFEAAIISKKFKK